jgi:hypothetical protein
MDPYLSYARVQILENDIRFLRGRRSDALCQRSAARKDHGPPVTISSALSVRRRRIHKHAQDGESSHLCT